MSCINPLCMFYGIKIVQLSKIIANGYKKNDYVTAKSL